MENLVFKKSEVLAALKKNREEHFGIVRESQQGYREKSVALLEEKLALLKSGKKVDMNFYLTVPVNHTDIFDQAIEMLEMSVGDQVKLTSTEFQRYVRNKWEWQGNFLVSNSQYSGTARKMSGDYTEEE